MFTVFTDGSCNINDRSKSNIGSYAFIILNDSGTKILESVEKIENTTNNRMELCAVIFALKKLKENVSDKILVYTDSEYVSNAVNKGWLNKWKLKDYKKPKTKTDIPNKDLWIQFSELLTSNVSIKWVRGHAGNIYNEQCDRLCKSVYKKNFIQAN